MKKRLLAMMALFALVLTAGFAVGCGDDDDDSGSDTTASGGGGDLELLEDGQLLVGTDTPFPPFEIGQPPDISGYDIEVMNAIGEKLGVEVTYQDTGFDTIFRDVANGQFDSAAAASTITPERQEKVNFTDPYYEAQQALLVPEGSDIATTADLGGVIVGAQDGTTGETFANDETDASEVRGFPEGPDAVAALSTGQVEAVIIDQPVAVDAVEKTGGVEIAEEIPTNELYGFAVALDKTNLVEAMNGALVELKDDGTLADLYQQYFQTDPPASVLDG
ncbi:MAG: amino acid ABC transporter substrate-binding protein, partial [Solirubrobacterales bacterium]|nr:amino acid ABC transporter substrate-binding protein [Solirubrobacterales bacterium]